MKQFFALAVLVFSFNVNAEIFYSKYLACKGTVQGDTTKMHPDYRNIAVTVTSFWSIRKKDCSLAPSSQMAFGYPKNLDFSLTDKERVKDEADSSTWYGRPLQRAEGKVMIPDLQMYQGEPLTLSVTGNGEGGMLKLEGYWDQQGSVVDNGEGIGYQLECVTEVSNSDELQVLNATAKCTNYPKKDDLD